MPTRPATICAEPACGRRVPSGRCDEHRIATSREYDRARGSASSRGYGRRWQRFRAWFLAKHPLCAECFAPATDVDHIESVSGPSDPLFYLEGNHRALCHPCHSRKTVTHDGGLGVARRHG